MVDRACIHVEAGAGGNGCSSFRREAHVPKGGPDGGDGGRGGDVVLVCDDSLRDLRFFGASPHFKAGRGGHGQGSLRHGADGDEKLIRVPPGTQVEGFDGTRYDFLAPGQQAIVARGGGGGRGNKRFAGPTRQAPRLVERGIAGEEGWLELTLKLLADAGLVGLPNAGKSSLLRSLTRATPKVGAYPFTTLEPALGTIERGERQLVVADIPGLIEGAAEGAGLGHDFLGHVERCRLLVHVLDVAPVDGSDPEESFATVEDELRRHDPRLAALPRVVALSKADLLPPDEASARAAAWRERFPTVLTSSATHDGLAELTSLLFERLPPEEVGEAPEVPVTHRVYRPAPPAEFSVRRLAPGEFEVSGPAVERLAERFDFTDDEALAHVESRLRGLGVIRALEAEGFVSGDDVDIAGTVFELS